MLIPYKTCRCSFEIFVKRTCCLTMLKSRCTAIELVFINWLVWTTEMSLTITSALGFRREANDNGAFQSLKKTCSIQAIENVLRVCIAWYKHERGWENSRQLCKPSTSSRVCITVENSPKSPSVYIRICKHRKKVFYCFYRITFPRKIQNSLVYILSCKHAPRPIRERILS